jgi:hypothetical protein
MKRIQTAGKFCCPSVNTQFQEQHYAPGASDNDDQQAHQLMMAYQPDEGNPGRHTKYDGLWRVFRYINFFKIIPDVYLNIYPFFNQINIAIAEQ